MLIPTKVCIGFIDLGELFIMFSFVSLWLFIVVHKNGFFSLEWVKKLSGVHFYIILNEWLGYIENNSNRQGGGGWQRRSRKLFIESIQAGVTNVARLLLRVNTLPGRSFQWR